MGAQGFAERARRELLAAGEAPAQRKHETGADLTPQEAQIARPVGDRLTDPEIAAQLYLSPRTVAHHLSNACMKLGISSRRELAEAQAAGNSTLAAV
jgi:DNA-binding CsgD family transcriptional regulator